MWQIQAIPTPFIWQPKEETVVVIGEESPEGKIIGGEAGERIGAEGAD